MWCLNTGFSRSVKTPALNALGPSVPSSRGALHTAPTVSLLLGRCPATIDRGVILFIIYTIKRFAWRAFTHVGKKVLKLFPASTDFNFFVSRIAVASNSSPHTAPRPIGRTQMSVLGVPMSCGETVAFFKSSTLISLIHRHSGYHDYYTRTSMVKYE